MRYIKTYEYMEKRPQVGEYVICEENSNIKEINDFLSQNIGKIVDIDGNKFEVLYNSSKIPNKISHNFYGGKRLMEIHEIIHHSYNIDDLESIIDGNKYNL